MNHTELASDHHDYWECLYNHKAICEALLYEGSEVAKILFQIQTHRLISLSQNHVSDETEIAYVLLTSLNRSLYTYILLHLDISLADCCYECRTHTHSITSTSSLLEAGSSIIDHYAENLKDNTSRYQHFRNACSYIQSHLEEDLTISQVCERQYISKSYLCRSFKELTGSTFSDYLKQQRIRRARMLLLSTDLLIEDIAARCGFQTPAYFSAVFKKEMNMTPSMFRMKFSNKSK